MRKPLPDHTNICFCPLSGILSVNPGLARFKTEAGNTIRYKGRLYCWANLQKGLLKLPEAAMEAFGIRPGDSLLVIRGSNLKGTRLCLSKNAACSAGS